MKYIVIVPDGMADYPIESLGSKTPLEAAHTPRMDFLALHGMVGRVRTIPANMTPGSDIGNLSVMGFNPSQHFSGRAPLEAANLGITIQSDEVVFRCNLVTINDQTMVDYSAGHISSAEAASLIDALNQQINMPQITFYAGKSYRHLLVIKTKNPSSFLSTHCVPPHDILNQHTHTHLPQGPEQSMLLTIMNKAQKILADHPLNHDRAHAQQHPANLIWLWGQGKKPHLQSFKEKFGLTGSVISAVDLVNGIGKLAGLLPITVPGATGYYDTNYLGKAQYALDSLQKHDFVFIHIEAPDEASHNGDVAMKIACIERIDQLVVGTILDHFCDTQNVRILVVPDHYTPVATRTHSAEPVCFAMYGKGIQPSQSRAYNEITAENARILFDDGESMMEYFIKKDVDV